VYFNLQLLLAMLLFSKPNKNYIFTKLKKVLHIIVFTLLIAKSYAQNTFSEIGSTFFNFNAGPSKYLGDIGGHPTKFSQKIKLDNSTFFFGASIQKYYKLKGFLEIGLQTGNLTASDNQIIFKNKLDPEYQRYLRNLDFKTKITEVALNYHVFPLAYFKNPSIKDFKIQPFLNFGIGYYSFNPMGSYYDVDAEETYWIPLQQFHTEGQGYAEYPDRAEYKLAQVNMQYGFGASYLFGERTRVSIGVQARKLYTDYLDDVSTTYISERAHANNITLEEDISYANYFTNKSKLIDPFGADRTGDIRGNPKNNDAYFSYFVKVGFRVKSKLSKKANYYKYDNDEICE
jgi:hypothetical protein